MDAKQITNLVKRLLDNNQFRSEYIANVSVSSADTAPISAKANAAFDQANTATTHGSAAFAQANTATTHSNSAFAQANIASPAFAQANTATTHGDAAFAQANTATTHGDAAFGKANTATTHGSAAFAQANTATTHANASYNKANTAVIWDGTYLRDNTSNIISGTQSVTTYSSLPTAGSSTRDVYLIDDLESFLWSDGTDWRPMNGAAVIYRLSSPFVVTAPSTQASAISNSSGKVALTHTAHGMTTGGTHNGRFIYVSTGTNWTTGLHQINTVPDANTIVLETTYSASLGVPTVSLCNGTDEIIDATISIPPLTAKSSLSIESVQEVNNTAGNKRTYHYFSTTQVLLRTDSSNIGSYVRSQIRNMNSKTFNKAYQNTGQSGAPGSAGTSATAEPNVNTAIASTATIRSTLAAVNDYIKYNDIIVTWRG